MKRQPQQHSFWKKMRFKYKLIFLNENTLEEVFSLRLSRLSVFWLLSAFAVVLVSLTAIVIINTPIRNYLPGYLDAEIREEMVQNALRTDSIEQVLHSQTAYLDNVNSILRGDNKVSKIPKNDTIISKTETNLQKSSTTAEFVKTYEEEEKYNLNQNVATRNLPDNLIFYKPIKGMISSHFDLKEKHYGVDIATSPKESVLSTMKGTVIFTGFDANAGYIIQIQHSNGFVSIYKHNAVLLKKEGNEVNASEAIALSGNTGTLSSGTHLHFELWYNGKPVNPEEFIAF
ncbi:MAG: M23 family metallopeptidase [Dysgonamonadaceae bacterium]|jgi:murein DD-endopeptidase MepM/ murein hydrolase activator NlpD|nr:M23 family metallopeptidase [Dysgonamonadaceae bacterium]